MNAGSCAKRAVMAVALLLAFGASARDEQRLPRDSGSDAGMQRMGSGQHRQQRGSGGDAAPQGLTAEERAAPRGWRLSREERHQLRRDVDEAGRDIYPERRHGRGRDRNQSSPAR